MPSTRGARLLSPAGDSRDRENRSQPTLARGASVARRSRHGPSGTPSRADSGLSGHVDSWLVPWLALRDVSRVNRCSPCSVVVASRHGPRGDAGPRQALAGGSHRPASGSRLLVRRLFPSQAHRQRRPIRSVRHDGCASHPAAGHTAAGHQPAQRPLGHDYHQRPGAALPRPRARPFLRRRPRPRYCTAGGGPRPYRARAPATRAGLRPNA